MSDQPDLPFALIAWIKEQQRKDQEHLECMQRTNAKNDYTYLMFLLELITHHRLNVREQIQVKNLVAFKQEGKNYSPAQKSMIAGLYYRKVS